MYIGIAIILLAVAISGKIMIAIFHIGSWVNTGLGVRRGNKVLNELNVDLNKQLDKITEETNFYARQNEKIRQKALDEANEKLMKDKKYEDDLSEILSNALSYLKKSYPLADNELFIEYSKAFFTEDVKLLDRIEAKMEKSHIENVNRI